MKASKTLKLAFWILIVLLAIFTFGYLQRDQDLISPLLNGLINPSLQSTVENSFNQNIVKYGIFIKNLNTGEEYRLNETDKFDGGSLYKLKLMVLVYEQIKGGRILEDELLSYDIGKLNRTFNIASDEAELKEGRVNFTVKSALEQMITISHNYAAMALTLKTKAGNLAGPVSAIEVGEFFEKLYKGEVIDTKYSKVMLDLLRRQGISDRIPKLLPEGIQIAHKTGDIGFFEHDAGIVFSPKADFIIVVLTESESPKEADENIAQISKAAFDYFGQKN